MLYCFGNQAGKDKITSFVISAVWLAAAAGVKVISNDKKYCTNPTAKKYACHIVSICWECETVAVPKEACQNINYRNKKEKMKKIIHHYNCFIHVFVDF
ncbi:hypothetical protein CDAR_619871 [Caerostris darwini]|uniref:Uncharacterized protein n=1 Tax=Caerostris darwini TaxID=1538125 RepID=A0AAV4VEL0_9ARAC|nr:hypothetical protein CDAR_619871 [Caerostris darwini]